MKTQTFAKKPPAPGTPEHADWLARREKCLAGQAAAEQRAHQVEVHMAQHPNEGHASSGDGLSKCSQVRMADGN